MAAQEQKGVLPRYADGAVVLMLGKDLNKINALIESWRPIAGKNVKVTTGPGGTRIDAGGGGDDYVPSCALGGWESNGDMTPGWFSGGGLSVLVEPGAIAPASNKKIWLKVTWTADKVDGVLMPGGSAGSVTVQTGSAVPDDDVPTVNSLSGKAYIALGGWNSEIKWVTAGCNVVQLSFCPGGFIKNR